MKTYIIVAKREKKECSRRGVKGTQGFTVCQMIFRADATELLLLLASPRWVTCCMPFHLFIK